MQIQSNRITKRNLLLFGGPLLLLLLAAGTYGYYRWSQNANTNQPAASLNKVDYSPPTDAQQQAGQDAKNNTINNTSGKPAAPGTDGNSQPPSDNTTIPMTITAASQNGSTLSIRSLIEAVTSSGTCTLTLTKGSVVVTKTSDIQPLANSSTCKGFDIPTSELSVGQWHIQLNVVVGDKNGKASKDITVQ